MKEATRKKQVLFIQGAGEGAYVEDDKLAVSLQAALGTEYQVLYPQMPNEEDPADGAWIAQISKALAVVDGSAILVGHSAGGAVLLKYLLKERMDQSIAGVFLISIPFWSPEDEADGTYTLREGFASQLPKGVPIFLYHSRDDEWVPFAHLAMFAERIPQAIIREFDGRGHQFNNDLSEVAEDIKGL
jgi:predicted alpha/beta hydrolase family esterase